MYKNRGFSLVVFLVLIAGLFAIGGGGYLTLKDTKPTDPMTMISTSTPEQKSPIQSIAKEEPICAEEYTEIDLASIDYRIDYISERYLADDDCVYLSNMARERPNLKLIPGADPDSFKILSNEYTKDKDHVYYLKSGDPILNNAVVVDGALPESFQVAMLQNGYPANFAYDAAHVFAYGKMVPGADVASIAYVNEMFFKDKNYVYVRLFDPQRIEILKGVLPAEFVGIGGEYGRFREAVYHLNQKIEGADAATFEVTGAEYAGWETAKDKYRTYSGSTAYPI